MLLNLDAPEFLLRDDAAVDDEGCAGDETGFIGSEIESAVCDVYGRAHPANRRMQQQPAGFANRIDHRRDHRRIYGAGTNHVDPNVLRTELDRERAPER